MSALRWLLFLFLVGGAAAAHAESQRIDGGINDLGNPFLPDFGVEDPLPPDDGGEDGGEEAGVDLGPRDLGVRDLGIRDRGVSDLGQGDDIGSISPAGDGGGLIEEGASCGCTSGRSQNRAPPWALLLFAVAISAFRLNRPVRRRLRPAACSLEP